MLAIDFTIDFILAALSSKPICVLEASGAGSPEEMSI